MTDRFLIVGLGNPGREYEKTRHNVGFRCVDAYAEKHGLSFAKKQSKALVAEGIVDNKRITLAKPQTYMNLSGESVRVLVYFYKIPLTHLLVISDDLDLPPGTLRIREKGSAGGQKGLKSIIEQLGTNEIPRLRIGIGRPPGRMDPSDYVLQDFGRDETILMAETLDRALKAVEVWQDEGLLVAMNRYNGTAEQAEEAARKAATPKPPRPSRPAPDAKDQPEIPPAAPPQSDNRIE